ncbi:unnamed protein product, partial [Meganyctiphanes norvegica]
MYKSKFCGGEIFTCSKSNNKAYDFWIPILISSGRLEINTALSRAMKNVKTGLTVKRNSIIQDSYSSYTQEIRDKYTGLFVTFKDFINHIFWAYDHRIGDHHWTPATVLCDACRIPYSYVLHMENFDQEIPYLLDILGFENLPNFGHANPSSKNGTSDYITYFNDLPTSMLKRLIKLYQTDFQLLGYSL